MIQKQVRNRSFCITKSFNTKFDTGFLSTKKLCKFHNDSVIFNHKKQSVSLDLIITNMQMRIRNVESIEKHCLFLDTPVSL